LFIKTIGYYTDKKLVDYRFLRNKIDKDTQKKYAKKHMVYYPMDPSSHKINDFFDISKEQKKTVLNFLKPDPDMIFTDASSNQYYKDSESIVVHDKDHIKRIDITNKLINNLNTRNFDFSKNKKNVDCANLQECIKEYNIFIDGNKTELFDGITPDEKTIIENELFGSPVFFYIIGKKLGFANCEIDDLDLEVVKKELDNQAGKFKNLLSQTLVNPKKPLFSSSSSSSPPPDDDDEPVVLKPKTKATLGAIESMKHDIDDPVDIKLKDKRIHSREKKGLVSPEVILAAALAILEAAQRFDNAATELKGNVDDAAHAGLVAAHAGLVATGEALRNGANYVGDEAGIARDNFVRTSNQLIRNAIEELGRAQVALRALLVSVGNTAGNVAESVQNATIVVIATVAQGLEDATVAIGAAARETANRVGNATRETANRVGNAARETANRVGNATRETVNRVGNATRETANRVGNATRETANRVGNAARETANRVGNATNRFRERFRRAGGKKTLKNKKRLILK
jgi:gas vesicle protein